MTFHKFHKIRTVGHTENDLIFSDPEDEIIIEEKIDGANFRFMFKEGEVIFGSRTQELTDDDEHKYQKNFRRCISYVYEKIKNVKTYDSFVFYGECCVKHTMNYDWDKIPPYLGFDILDLKTDKFLDYDKKVEIFKDLDLPIVPLISRNKAKDINKIDDDCVPVAFYASPSNKDTKAEGIVFKNYDKGIYAKYVREIFKEKNAEVFGGTPKYEDTDTGIFCAKYCTNARIEKMVFKLIDEGNKLDMPLMEYLPKRVFEDIWEEEWKEIIFKGRPMIDIGKFRKIVTKRCVEVLKQILVNNILNKER